MADGHIIETRTLPLEALPLERPAPESNLDRLGIGISLGCAIHCVASALIALVPSLLPRDLSPWLERLEWPFLVGAAIVGATSLVPSFRRHGDARPVSLFTLGMGMLAGSRFMHGPMEIALTVTAVTIVAAAHVLNLRACSSARVCAH